jgi:hypothetical protein
VEIRRYTFPFFVNVFMTLSLDVRVEGVSACLLVCCVVQKKGKGKVYPTRSHDGPMWSRIIALFFNEPRC